jgi:putative nucleotidyltransferase with HDIG domain
MRALDNYIDEVKTLPPAPRILTQLLILLNQDDTNAREIVELVSLDPALTAKVLQRCNNAASGLNRRIADTDEAVTLVGFSAIYRLVLMVVGEGLLGSEQPGYGIGAGELWEHSVTSAVAARVIARKQGGDENLAFTGALLHDIGKLVLSTFLEGDQRSVLSRTGPSGDSFLEAEKAIVGADHAEIGGRLLERWNFPENLVAAVRHHHDPGQAGPHKDLAAFVHLGDIIAHCLGLAQGHESFAVRTRAEALQILEISPKEIEILVLETDAALQQCNGFTRLQS